MASLAPGSTLLVWPRATLAVADGKLPCAARAALPDELPGLANGELGALGELLGAHAQATAALEDAATVARLAELDALYYGWIPGFLADEAFLLTEVRALHARRRAHAPLRAAWPTLPASVVRRYRAVLQHNPKRLYLDDDADGLGLLLAKDREVVLFEPDALRRLWLVGEAERAGLGARLCVVASAPQGLACDAALIAAGPPHQARAALLRAAANLGPGGLIFAQLGAPFDETFLDEAQSAGLVLVEHLRELNQPVLPGGFVLASGSDLVVLRCERAPAWPAALDDAAARARACPYLWVDLDELRATGLELGILNRLGDLLAALHTSAEAMRTVVTEEGREILVWYGADGAGLTAELYRAERHLLVNFMPYDPQLEQACLCAAFYVLGDSSTRLRPRLTVRFGKEKIIA